MTKPIPDKAEVAVEYPDKLYIGTFERTARFDAHLDEAGISLSLHRTGADETRKTVRMHFHSNSPGVSLAAISCRGRDGEIGSRLRQQSATCRLGCPFCPYAVERDERLRSALR